MVAPPVNYYTSATLSSNLRSFEDLFLVSPFLAAAYPIDHREAASKFTVKFIGDKRGNVLPVEKSPPLQLLLTRVGTGASRAADVFSRYNSKSI